MFQFNENVYPGSKFCKSEQHSMTETGKAIFRIQCCVFALFGFEMNKCENARIYYFYHNEKQF